MTTPCSQCGHPTYIGSIFCENCGENLIESNKEMSLSNTEPNANVLYLVIDREKLVFRPPFSAILGRAPSQQSGEVSVDLSKYSRSEHGISRRHLAVFSEESKFFIRDLGSTNGSWKNLDKIIVGINTEICDGDQIRLGLFQLQVKIENGEK